jgi:hypothetical protein
MLGSKIASFTQHLSPVDLTQIQYCTHIFHLSLSFGRYWIPVVFLNDHDCLIRNPLPFINGSILIYITEVVQICILHKQNLGDQSGRIRWAGHAIITHGEEILARRILAGNLQGTTWKA